MPTKIIITIVTLLAVSANANACPDGKVWGVRFGVWSDKAIPPVNKPGGKFRPKNIPVTCETTPVRPSRSADGNSAGSSVNLSCRYDEGHGFFAQAWYSTKKNDSTVIFRTIHLSLSGPNNRPPYNIDVDCFDVQTEKK